MDLGIVGRRAFVAGSSSGIGAGIARALAGEGAHVIVHGRSEASAGAVVQQIRDAGGTAQAVLGDLTIRDSVDQVAAGVAALGPVDILINCAGAGSSRSWFDVSIDDWHERLRHSLLYAVQLIHAFVPPMQTRGWGRVLNISTTSAFKVSGYGPEYTASKIGLNSVAASLAMDLADSGVTINTLTCGLVLTENTRTPSTSSVNCTASRRLMQRCRRA